MARIEKVPRHTRNAEAVRHGPFISQHEKEDLLLGEELLGQTSGEGEISRVVKGAAGVKPALGSAAAGSGRKIEAEPPGPGDLVATGAGGGNEFARAANGRFGLFVPPLEVWNCHKTKTADLEGLRLVPQSFAAGDDIDLGNEVDIVVGVDDLLVPKLSEELAVCAGAIGSIEGNVN
jgi:hypothetical protein